jgi:hypothetical protein
MTPQQARMNLSPAAGNDGSFERWWNSTAMAKLEDDNPYKAIAKGAAWSAFAAACRLMCEEIQKYDN